MWAVMWDPNRLSHKISRNFSHFLTFLLLSQLSSLHRCTEASGHMLALWLAPGIWRRQVENTALKSALLVQREIAALSKPHHINWMQLPVRDYDIKQFSELPDLLKFNMSKFAALWIISHLMFLLTSITYLGFSKQIARVKIPGDTVKLKPSSYWQEPTTGVQWLSLEL